MKKYKLPVDYKKLQWFDRKAVREQYVQEQEGKCFYCSFKLEEEPPISITEKEINWDLFPPNFLAHPIHNVFYLRKPNHHAVWLG